MYDACIHSITAATVISNASSSINVVPMNGSLSLFIELTADPVPDDIWQFNGNDIIDTTNPTFK